MSDGFVINVTDFI